MSINDPLQKILVKMTFYFNIFNFKNVLPSTPSKNGLRQRPKNNVQEMSINDPLQKILVKMTFYFNIFKQSILDFFLELPISL